MWMSLDGLDVKVEVKAPFRARPESGGWSGGESDKIAEAMKQANKQFGDETPNVLALVPQLRVRMFPDRDDLLRAAFGHTHLVVPIDRDGNRAGPSALEFCPRGNFLNAIRPGGLPGYRRISAIICIEERVAYKYPSAASTQWVDDDEPGFWRAYIKAFDLHESLENEAWVEHDVLVLHNPNAYRPLPQEPWRAFPQLVVENERMKWTDDQKVIL
jgi:hypothetical protein